MPAAYLMIIVDDTVQEDGQEKSNAGINIGGGM